MSESLSSATLPLPDLNQYPGLRVLRDVASYLESGIGTDEVFEGIIAALTRGLGARESRIWVRTPDGAAFRAFVAGGAAAPSTEEAARASHWVAEGEGYEVIDGRVHVRAP